MKFEDLKLDSRLFQSIQSLGYSEATPIQTQAIPLLMAGKDVAGLAQTGTGKTAAFVIPMMDRILKSEPGVEKGDTVPFDNWKSHHFVLILVPTRELAEQVQDNILKIGEAAGLKGFAIYGGTGYDRQKEALKNNTPFIVATPGRLIDLYKEHLVDLKQVRAIVFDEADRMFDMGFKDDMKYILQRVPQDRQFLVFSATLNLEVLNTAYQFGSEPVEINISRDQAKADNVTDSIFHVGVDEKPQILLSLIRKNKPKQLIIFTNFKFNVDRISRFLTDNGHPAMAISSLITQVQRNKVIENFKAENDLNILVATDVAARGLDIKGVDMVINYELPGDSESYVHRIGRTGRAGATGVAFSLVCDKDIEALYRIEDYLKHKLEVNFLETNDLLQDFKPLRDDFASRRPNPSSGNGPKHSGPRKEFNPKPKPQGSHNQQNGSHSPQGPRPPRDHQRKQAHPAKPSSQPRPPHPQSAKNGAPSAGLTPVKPRPNGPKKPFVKRTSKKPMPQPITKKISTFFKKLFGN